MGFMAGNQATLDWASQAILPMINQISNECSEFATLIRKGGSFHQHVPVEKKMSVVQWFKLWWMRTMVLADDSTS
jgi:hypothetical protein